MQYFQSVIFKNGAIQKMVLNQFIEKYVIGWSFMSFYPNERKLTLSKGMRPQHGDEISLKLKKKFLVCQL